MNDLGNLLQMIYDLLSGWFTSFTSHATAVMEKLNLIETDTASIKNSASDIKSNTDDIKDNTGAIITPVQSIKTNTDSIKTDTTTIKNNVSTMTNQLGTISTNVGTASAFTEDVANNTLDIKDRIVTIGSDTTQLRSNSNTITSDVSDIKTALNYYLANTPITEDVDGYVCNIDTDLTDYLQACNVTIPADLTGFSGITLNKIGRNFALISSLNVDNSQNINVIYNNNILEFTAFGTFSRVMYKIPVKNGCTYTLSFKGYSDGTNKRININNDNTWPNSGYYGTLYINTVTEAYKQLTFTAVGDYVYLSFYVTTSASTGSLTIKDMLLEYGSNKSTYEPYKAMTYPVSFGTTITDGAEINLLDGIIKVNSTPVSYLSISPIAVRTYKGVNNIYSDIGTTALTYRETLKHYIEKQEA